MKPGLPIELKSPIVEEKIIVKIAELKPQLISDSLAIDVIADIVNQPNWQAGGSVRGTVVFKEISNLSVPEQSIILRPAGQVVYVIKDNVAYGKVCSNRNHPRWKYRNYFRFRAQWRNSSCGGSCISHR